MRYEEMYLSELKVKKKKNSRNIGGGGGGGGGVVFGPFFQHRRQQVLCDFFFKNETPFPPLSLECLMRICGNVLCK